MGVVEDLVKNKEEILLKLLSLIEGKEAKGRLKLDGVKLKLGKSEIKMDGAIELTFTPMAEKAKKK